MGREGPNILQMTPGTKSSSSTLLVQLRVPMALWMLVPLPLFPPQEAEDMQTKRTAHNDSKSISQSGDECWLRYLIPLPYSYQAPG